MIARCKRHDRRSDRFDDARALVAKHDRKAPELVVAVERCEITVTHSGGVQPYQHFVRIRLAQIELDDLERLCRLERHGCLGFHLATLP